MHGYLARNIRTQLGLDQKQLARIAHVSRKAVSSFENNEPLKLLDRQKILTRLYAEKVKISSRNYAGVLS
jgi:transcriptional regulator with XRE-family HTH domain